MSYLYIETNYPTACMFEKFLSWWTIPDGGNLRLYFGLYNNATSGWQYFSGNVTHGLSTGSKLVNRGSSESSAQSSYLAANSLVDSNDRLVCILPQVSVAKRVRIYVESGHQVVLKHWIAGERLNAGEIVTGNITMTDQYRSPPKITVVASANEYLKVGKLNATDFGIKGFDGNANRVFEISDADIMLGGKWDFSGTLLASNLTVGGSAGKITAGVGDLAAFNDGSHGTYRFYVGNASPTAAWFKIDKNGNAYITHGSVTASIISGENYVTATSLTASSVGSTELAGEAVKDAHLSGDEFNFDSNINVASNIVVSGKIHIGESIYLGTAGKVHLGNASLAALYHDGTGAYITNVTGDINVLTGGSDATALTIDTNQDAKFFGSVDSVDGYTTGNLTLTSNTVENATNLAIQTPTAGTGDISLKPRLKNSVVAVADGPVRLYHNNVLKSRTATDGFIVSGKLNVSASITGNFANLPTGPSITPSGAYQFTNKVYVDTHVASYVDNYSDKWIFSAATPLEVDRVNDADYHLNTVNGNISAWYIEPDTVTARSVVFDIADNWGNATHTNIRSIKFYRDNSLITVNASNASAYVTTYEASYNAMYAFDTATALSVTGTALNNSWQSDTGASRLENRLTVVFDAEHMFDSIQVQNGHNSGAETNSGANNVKIWVTTATIVDTTYAATITGSTRIYDGIFDEHTATNISDNTVVWAGASDSRIFSDDISLEVNATGNEIATYLGGAFDGDLTTDDVTGAWYAYSGGYQTTGWTGQDFGSGNTPTVAQYRILSNSDNKSPANWTFEGSNNASWLSGGVTLDTQASTLWPSSTMSWNTYTISSPAPYRYYRVNVTANNGNATYLAIQEIEMRTASPLGGYYSAWYTIYTPTTGSGSGLNEWHEDANGNLIPNALGQDIGTTATPVRSMYLSASTLYIGGKDINATIQDHTSRIVYLEASVADLNRAVNNLEASTFELSENSVVATHIKAGALTSNDLRDEDFRFTQDIMVSSNASINGNITVGGTVDGVDIANLSASVSDNTTAINSKGNVVYIEEGNTLIASALLANLTLDFNGTEFTLTNVGSNEIRILIDTIDGGSF